MSPYYLKEKTSEKFDQQFRPIMKCQILTIIFNSNDNYALFLFGLIRTVYMLLIVIVSGFLVLD